MLKKLAFLQNGEIWLNDARVRDAIGVTEAQANAIAQAWGRFNAQWRAQSERDIDKAIFLLDAPQKQAALIEVKKLYHAVREDTARSGTMPGEILPRYLAFTCNKGWTPEHNVWPFSMFFPVYELLCFPEKPQEVERHGRADVQVARRIDAVGGS